MKKPKKKFVNFKKVLKDNNNIFKYVVSRNSTILPKLVGNKIDIHNGKTFSELNVKKEMVGFKCGEFVTTRAVFSFKKKRKKK